MLGGVAFAFMYALIIFSHFLFLKSLNIVTSVPAWRETHRDELNHGYFDYKGTETLHTSRFLHDSI